MTTVAEGSDKEHIPHKPTDEFFEIFNVATRSELISLREFLATEEFAALNASDIVRATVIEESFDRAESLLQRIGRREVRAAVRAAEFSGVNCTA